MYSPFQRRRCSKGQSLIRSADTHKLIANIEQTK